MGPFYDRSVSSLGLIPIGKELDALHQFDHTHDHDKSHTNQNTAVEHPQRVLHNGTSLTSRHLRGDDGIHLSNNLQCYSTF